MPDVDDSWDLDEGKTHAVVAHSHLDAVREGLLGSSSRVLLVGEHNPYGPRPEYQLVNYPQGCAGERLQRLVLGLPEADYLGLWRTNLCFGRGWILGDARARAEFLLAAPDSRWNVIVMLGRKVASAFRYKEEAFSYSIVSQYRLMTLVALPHPSGRCRAWNEPGAVTKARAILRWLVPEVPWGSV